MGSITRQDILDNLLYGDYVKRPKEVNDDPDKRESDSEHFNRKEIYEVIDLIKKIIDNNHVTHQCNIPRLIQLIEELIYSDDCKGIQSRVEVIDCIEKTLKEDGVIEE